MRAARLGRADRARWPTRAAAGPLRGRGAPPGAAFAEHERAHAAALETLLFALTVPVRSARSRSTSTALLPGLRQRRAAPRRSRGLAELEGAAIAGYQLIGRRRRRSTRCARGDGHGRRRPAPRRPAPRRSARSRPEAFETRPLSRYPDLEPMQGKRKAMPFNVGPLELVIVLVIALVILGPKRLPEVGKSIGNGMREFKDAISGS